MCIAISSTFSVFHRLHLKRVIIRSGRVRLSLAPYSGSDDLRAGRYTIASRIGPVKFELSLPSTHIRSVVNLSLPHANATSPVV